RYADGLATSAEYNAVGGRAADEAQAADYDPPDARSYATACAELSDHPTVESISSGMYCARTARACAAAASAAESEYDATHDATRRREMRAQERLVLDIFGPFPPLTLAVDPSWLTSTLLALAR